MSSQFEFSVGVRPLLTWKTATFSSQSSCSCHAGGFYSDNRSAFYPWLHSHGVKSGTVLQACKLPGLLHPEEHRHCHGNSSSQGQRNSCLVPVSLYRLTKSMSTLWSLVFGLCTVVPVKSWVSQACDGIDFRQAQLPRIQKEVAAMSMCPRKLKFLGLSAGKIPKAKKGCIGALPDNHLLIIVFISRSYSRRRYTKTCREAFWRALGASWSMTWRSMSVSRLAQICNCCLVRLTRTGPWSSQTSEA